MTAGVGGVAVGAVRPPGPALVLMDLRMPVLDGTAAMRQIRAIPGLAQTAIVALTAHALDDEHAAALAAGFDAVISKPCLPADLLLAVQKVLGLPDAAQ
jgi:CheY-like chemotaxis protein